MARDAVDETDPSLNRGGLTAIQASPDNFRVSVSNMMIGANPVEPRDTNGNSGFGHSDHSTSDNEPQFNEDAFMSSEEQSEPASSSQDNDDPSASGEQDESNEESVPEGQSSEKPDSTSDDESYVGAKKKKKNPAKDRRQVKDDDATSSDQKSSKTDATSSGDSGPEASSGENRQKGKAKKKQGKLSKLESTDDSSGNPASSKDENASTNEAGDSAAGDTTDGDDSGWSVSEDCLLRGMKEANDGISWVDIGKALHRGKGEVKARWKVIRDQPQNVTSDEGDTSQTGQTSSAPRTESGEQTEDSDRHPDSSQGKERKGKAVIHTKWHTGKRNQKVAAENQKAKSRAIKAQETIGADLSGEEASSESDPKSETESEACASDSSEEEHRQDRYHQDHILTKMYPPLIHPQPSAHFDERDCAVLAAVDSKYKRSKWLEMQANFYNVTGRMVPLHIIRAKCEQAEEEEQQKRERREGVDGRKKVEKWVSSISHEYHDDPDE